VLDVTPITATTIRVSRVWVWIRALGYGAPEPQPGVGVISGGTIFRDGTHQAPSVWTGFSATLLVRTGRAGGTARTRRCPMVTW